MKLKLMVNPPANGHAFQPNDLVQGRVEVHNVKKASTEAVANVRIVFQGTVRVALKPGCDAASQMTEAYRREKYKLFSFVQDVHPQQDCRDDGSKTDGRVADFAFTFPSAARHCLCKQMSPPCPLPPSTRFYSSSAMDVRIVYTLTAVCRRPGRFHRLLHTCAKVKRVLDYGTAAGSTVPSGDDDYHPLVCSMTWLPAGKLIGMDESETASGCQPPRSPPPYSPAIAFEIVLPYPPVLTPGECFVIGLFVRVPDSLVGKAVARSLTVALHRTMTARVASSVRVDHAGWPVWSVRGRLPLQHKKVSIACGQAVDGSTKLYGLRIPLSVPARPGFISCSVSRVYFLHARMGVSVTGITGVSTSDTHYAETSVDVDVSGPPPAYNGDGRGELIQDCV